MVVAEFTSAQTTHVSSPRGDFRLERGHRHRQLVNSIWSSYFHRWSTKSSSTGLDDCPAPATLVTSARSPSPRQIAECCLFCNPFTFLFTPFRPKSLTLDLLVRQLVVTTTTTPRHSRKQNTSQLSFFTRHQNFATDFDDRTPRRWSSCRCQSPAFSRLLGCMQGGTCPLLLRWIVVALHTTTKNAFWSVCPCLGGGLGLTCRPYQHLSAQNDTTWMALRLFMTGQRHSMTYSRWFCGTWEVCKIAKLLKTPCWKKSEWPDE